MNERAEPEPALTARDASGTTARAFDWRPFAAALGAGATYYAGAKVGLALTFDPSPISILWPPNALLFGCLLVTPRRWWWLVLLGAFPAHLLAELQDGVPAAMVLCWFVSNVSESLIGVLLVQHFAGTRPGLGSVHAVVVFCGAAALSPFLTSFFDAGFVRLIGWGQVDYWTLWQTRFVANMLAMLTFVPVVMTWAAVEPQRLRQIVRERLPEAILLLTGLLAVTVAAFDSGTTAPSSFATLLYLPMPFLVWAALRFGPPLTTACFTLVALLVIWGAGHGRGPFPHDSALPIQLFLISVAVPLLLLAAVIHERVDAERKLRASQKLFSTAFRSSPDAMAISRRSDGRIIDVNDRWLALLAYARDELARGSIAPLASHVDDPARAGLLSLPGGVAELRDVEVTLRDCQGRTRQGLVSTKAVEVQEQACLISTVRDITEQRRAEMEAREQHQQLAHLTRVASLTDFSSTLAHELNQPLTAILSNAQAAQRLLARDPSDLSEIHSILAEIVEADKRADLVIQRIRLLMKKGSEEFVRLDLNQLVAEVLDFVHGEFVTHHVEVRPSFAPQLPPVKGDRVQLQQLVLNLVSNACEAMHGHDGATKTLSIATLLGADGRVQVIISDTGPGIAPDGLDRVFDPFFTTKESGLGLGLAICRKIARAHGGTLVADDRDGGGGASLRLVLPPASRGDEKSGVSRRARQAR